MREKYTPTPVAQNVLNRKEKNTVDVYHESTNVYFRPETEELIILAEDGCHDFERHWSEMLACVNDAHEAGRAYSLAIEKYGDKFSTPSEKSREREL